MPSAATYGNALTSSSLRPGRYPPAPTTDSGNRGALQIRGGAHGSVFGAEGSAGNLP